MRRAETGGRRTETRVDADDPLLFACGQRSLFTSVSEAAARIMNLEGLRGIGPGGHLEPVGAVSKTRAPSSEQHRRGVAALRREVIGIARTRVLVSKRNPDAGSTRRDDAAIDEGERA